MGVGLGVAVGWGGVELEVVRDPRSRMLGVGHSLRMNNPKKEVFLGHLGGVLQRFFSHSFLAFFLFFIHSFFPFQQEADRSENTTRKIAIGNRELGPVEESGKPQ